MRDCCSSQEDTFGEIFGLILKNYIPFWIIFSIGCFAFVILNFFWKQRQQMSTSEKTKED